MYGATRHITNSTNPVAIQLQRVKAAAQEVGKTTMKLIT